MGILSFAWSHEQGKGEYPHRLPTITTPLWGQAPLQAIRGKLTLLLGNMDGNKCKAEEKPTNVSLATALTGMYGGKVAMKDAILAELAACEQKHDVKILYAAECGSRSWGLANQGSDYDVRFVYVRRKDDYLRLEAVRDTIDWRLDDDLDIVGWDLSKFLRLLRNSNPSVFEWLGSGVVYAEDEAFGAVRSLARRCVSPKSLALHYLGMASGNNRHLQASNQPGLKRYLHTIRALLACKWVVEQMTCPPLSFDELCDYGLAVELRPAIQTMVDIKRSGEESGGQDHVPELDSWISVELNNLKDAASHIESTDKLPWRDLNQVFLELVEHTDMLLSLYPSSHGVDAGQKRV